MARGATVRVARAAVWRGRGQTLVEILLALIILSSCGLVVFSASTRSLQTTAWSSERVLAETLVGDLVETYRSFDYCTLVNDRSEIRATEADVTAADLETVARLAPLASASFFARPPATEAEALGDPIYREYVELVRALALERFVLAEPPGSALDPLVVTCVVRWRSRAGPEVVIRKRFVKFKTGRC